MLCHFFARISDGPCTTKFVKIWNQEYQCELHIKAILILVTLFLYSYITIHIIQHLYYCYVSSNWQKQLSREGQRETWRHYRSELLFAHIFAKSNKPILSVIVHYSFNASCVRVLNSVHAYDTRKKTMSDE